MNGNAVISSMMNLRYDTLLYFIFRKTIQSNERGGENTLAVAIFVPDLQAKYYTVSCLGNLLKFMVRKCDKSSTVCIKGYTSMLLTMFNCFKYYMYKRII